MRALRIVSYPSLSRLITNPYWLLLMEGLKAQGCTLVEPAQYSLRWLWQNKNNVNILHFHYVQQFYAYEQHYARLRWVFRMWRNFIFLRQWGYKTVFTVHNLIPSFPLKPYWIDYLGHYIVANRADKIIVHCNKARESFIKMYHRRNEINLIEHPNYIGIYENKLSKTQARKLLGYEDTQLIFLFFGGVRPNKGVERVIRAFSKLKNPNCRLLIVGKGSSEEYVRQLEKLALKDERIELRAASFIPDDEVQGYLNAADVVVLPFSGILTSGSAMLALSFGKPVIAPAMGCLPEELGDAGLFYDGSEDGLLAVLKETPVMPLDKLGEIAFRRAKQFNQTEFVRQHMNVYCSLAKA